MVRKRIPDDLASKILNEAHHRCAICPEHKRIANIHHIDENHANNAYDNLVGVCAECHADLHTTSTMRRNITQDQIRTYKSVWVEECNKLEKHLSYNDMFIHQFYYINVHRLETLYRTLTGNSVIKKLPHKFLESQQYYNSLWNNPKNSLTWTQLLDVRTCLEECAKEVLENVRTYNLSLVELGAINPNEFRGDLVHFSCEFNGKDIPDQGELISNGGFVEGPQGTIRREIMDEENDEIFETCALLDPLYMYSDSAFIQLSEHGIWNGIAMIGPFREGIGSNDGHFLRKQLILTPLFLGTPSNLLVSSRIKANGATIDEYSVLHDSIAI